MTRKGPRFLEDTLAFRAVCHQQEGLFLQLLVMGVAECTLSLG